MTTANFTTRPLNVPALVTAAVAAWFVLASGTALAETTQPGVAPCAQTQITMSPEGTMKLTVVAARRAAQITMTPKGTMRLTVVAPRIQGARVHTAAVRETSPG